MNLNKKNYNKIIIESLEARIQELENEFKNSQKRKDLNWKVSKLIKSKLKVLNGELNFIRIQYWYIDTNNKRRYVFFDNPALRKKQGKSPINNCIKNEVISLAVNGLSYKSIQKTLSVKISISTISNIMKEQTKSLKVENYYEESKNKEYIYLEIDDSYQPLKNIFGITKKYRNRVFVLHLGKDETNNVIAKTVLIENKITDNNLQRMSIEEWKNYILNKVKEIYGENLKFIVYGDGARWINRIAKNLKATFILDPFHINFKLFKAIGFNKYTTRNKMFFANVFPEFDCTIYQKIKQKMIDSIHKSNKPPIESGVWFSFIISLLEKTQRRPKL